MSFVARKHSTFWYLGKKRVPAGTPGAVAKKKISQDYFAFWTDEQGRKHSKCFKGCRERRHAERLLQRHLASLNQEEPTTALKPPQPEPTLPPLSQILEEYEQDLRTLGRAPHYVSQIVHHLKLAQERGLLQDLANLTPASVYRYAQEHGRCARSRNIIMGYLKRLALWAVRRGYLTQSPLLFLESVQGPKVRLRRALDAGELQKLLDAARLRPLERYLHGTSQMKKVTVQLSAYQRKRLEQAGHQRALVYKMAVLTLARFGAIRSLTVDCLHLDEEPPRIIFGQTKKRSPIHKILHPELAQDLREWLKLSGKTGSQTLFDLPRNLTRDLRKDLAFAGIPYKDGSGRTFDFHAFKRSGITALARASVHLKAVQEYAEHADIRMTLEVYTEALGLGSKELLDAMPKLS
jgi:integrase